MKKVGISVTYEDIYTREGQPGMNSVREIFAKYGKPFNPRQAKEILLEKEQWFKKIVRLRFIPGVRSFLKRLHANNFRLALATGTSRHELLEILPESVRDLFSVVVTGSDVRRGKPHPEPYIKSLKKLKIDPAAAVVIENAPFGIQSAKEAGIKCLAIETSLPREYLWQADAVFGSIRELREHVSFLGEL